MSEERASGLENIYLKRQSASSFTRAIRYGADALARVADILASHPSLGGDSAAEILDVGTGPGSFILPVVEAFDKNGRPDYRLHCLDASQHMARTFEANLAASRVKKENVQYLLGDLELGLGGLRSPLGYDLIFATFVLHYVKNWRPLLDEIVEGLGRGGLLVLTEVIGDFRNIDGQFDVKSPILFRQFWKRYFTERAAYSSWPPAISVSDLSVVFTYLHTMKRLELFREDSLLWDTELTWGDMVDWVMDAPLSSLGAGLGAEDRNQLARVMRAWLGEKAIEPSAAISLTWGVKVTCLTKMPS